MKRPRLEYQIAIYHRSAPSQSPGAELGLEVAGIGG
jgi:hypothetical protein